MVSMRTSRSGFCVLQFSSFVFLLLTTGPARSMAAVAIARNDWIVHDTAVAGGWNYNAAWGTALVNTAPQANALSSSTLWVYTFTGLEDAAIDGQGGSWTTVENIYWQENDVGPDDDIASVSASFAHLTNPSSVIYRPSAAAHAWVSSVAAHGGDCELVLEHDVNWALNPQSEERELTNGAATVAAGSAAGAARAGTAGVAYAIIPPLFPRGVEDQVGRVPAAGLAIAAGTWPVYSFTDTGSMVLANGSNATGYNLRRAVDNTLIHADDDKTVFETTPSETIYATGSSQIGSLSVPATGTNYFAANLGGGSDYFGISGYGETFINPALLPSNGQQSAISYSQISNGDTHAFWVMFENGQGFLILAPRGSVAPVPTVSEWGLIILTLSLIIAATILFARGRRMVQIVRGA